MDQIHEEPSKIQSMLMSLYYTLSCIRDNIRIFQNQTDKRLEIALQGNILAFNSILSTMLYLKGIADPIEYQDLIKSNQEFEEFDQKFLQEELTIEAPKPKSKIILLGD